jgi:hypothetical protein
MVNSQETLVLAVFVHKVRFVWAKFLAHLQVKLEPRRVTNPAGLRSAALILRSSLQSWRVETVRSVGVLGARSRWDISHGNPASPLTLPLAGNRV